LPALTILQREQTIPLHALHISSHRQAPRRVPPRHQIIPITPPYPAATPASEAGADGEEEVKTETNNCARGFAKVYARDLFVPSPLWDDVIFCIW